jgi:hypothetical protein
MAWLPLTGIPDATAVALFRNGQRKIARGAPVPPQVRVCFWADPSDLCPSCDLAWTNVPDVPVEPLPIKTILERLDLGSSVAEHDDLLQQHFVETSTFNKVVENRVDIVAGEKGTGKTAIFRILSERYKSLPQLQDVEVVAAFNPVGTPIFQRLLETQTLAEDQYITVWKSYFVSLAGNWILNFFDGDFSEEMQKLDRLLCDAELRSEDETPRTLFDKIVSRIKRFIPFLSTAEATVTTSAEGIPILGAKVAFGEKSGNDAPANLVRPDDVLRTVQKMLIDNNIKIWLVLDRLDEAFQGHPDFERPALRALFRTYLDMLDFDNIRLKLFVRRDLFSRIVTGGFVNLTHIAARRVEITWDDDDLRDLLIRRLRGSQDFIKAINASDLDDDALFTLIFPDQVDQGSRKPNTWTWIMGRIRDGNHVKPPRNLIDLVQNAQDQQIKREERDPRTYSSASERLLTSDALKRGLQVLSNDRVEDTLLAEAGDYAEVIKLFRNGKAEHNIETLTEILKDNVEVTTGTGMLKTLGFLEQTGTTYKIPMLYRNGLNITQGKAFSDAASGGGSDDSEDEE